MEIINVLGYQDSDTSIFIQIKICMENHRTV